jgi:ubiquitin C-terminal hydrolase
MNNIQNSQNSQNSQDFLELSRMFSDLNNNSNVVKNPSSLKHFLGKHNEMFIGNHQEDAHECLITIIDIVHNLSKYVPKTRKYPEMSFDRLPKDQVTKSREQYTSYIKIFGYSFINEIFNGQFISNVKCSECDYQNNSFDVFNSIILDIPEDANPDIYDCFNNYLKTIELFVFCDNCKKNTRMTKRTSIWKFPKIFIITLSRFSGISSTKNSKSVNINPIIKFQIHRNSTTDKNVEFSLKSFIMHVGSKNYGHYNTIVFQKNEYYIIDDDKYFKMKNPVDNSNKDISSNKDNSKDSSNNFLYSSSAYVLLYEMK